jgi:hypothetical protein
VAKSIAKGNFDAPAFRFVLILGIVNLFGDTTYEGGGSIISERSERASSRLPSSPGLASSLATV